MPQESETEDPKDPRVPAKTFQDPDKAHGCRDLDFSPKE